MNKHARNASIGLLASGLTLAMAPAANADSNTYNNTPGTPVAIPDNSATGATLSINVPDGGTVNDVNVGLVIAHTWQGDLTATISHGGTTVTIINRPGQPQTGNGFSADNFGNPTGNTLFVLSDEASQGPYDVPEVAAPGTANPTGTWIPDNGNLGAFKGQSMSGNWTLKVVDSAGQDVGTIRRLNLVINFNLPGCPNTSHGCFETGTTGCSDGVCCNTVCGLDPFCCDTSWDSLCVDEAKKSCAPTGCGYATHNCLTEGSAGCTATDCCNLVCAVDTFCCVASWDSLCVGEAERLCLTANCGATSHGCFSTGSAGCNNPDCCESVCAVDPFCCDSSWDSICVGEANNLCGSSSCPNPAHACNTTGSAGCSNETCCNLVCALDSFCCEVSWDSLCVDAAIDSGCASPQSCDADIFPVPAGDGTVGPGDLGQLLSKWGPCPAPCSADLFPVVAGDGTVGPGDLGQLLSEWGQCN